MIRNAIWTVIGLAVLTGCGGSSSVLPVSPFAGKWTGTALTMQLQAGQPMSLTIAPDGTISGTNANPDGTVTFVDTGTVDAKGNFNITGVATGKPNENLTGTVTISGAGDLMGTGTGDGAGLGQFSFDLKKS